MQINYIELKNIRSYKSQIINFKLGKSMLAGDIGSGKTSLLLSIEFALFGLLRGGSGTTLLRHGSTNGSVKLSITIDKKEYVIYRGLKRSSGGNVTQDKGYLIANESQYDGMPTEITARVLEILGYPNDATKKDNFIYRFTVYTPQEEMKKVLFETTENRLNTIRKIFSIDKYKDVRENLQVIVKELRVKQREIDSYCRDLPEKKTLLKKNTEEIVSLQKENCLIKLKLNEEELKLNDINKSLNDYEDLIKKFYSEKEKLSIVKNNIKNNEHQLINNTKKLDLNTEKITDFERTITKKINSSINDLENIIPEANNKLIDEIENIKSRIGESEEEENKNQWISESTGDINRIIDSTELIFKTEEDKNKLKIKEYEEKISASNHIINQSENLKNKINDLSKCPTCMQDVKDEYKSKIIEEETKKQNNSNIEKSKIISELNELKELNLIFSKNVKAVNEIKNNLRIINIESKGILNITNDINETKEQILTIKAKNTELEKALKESEKQINKLSKVEEEYKKIKAKKEQQERLTKLEQIKLTRNTTEISEKNKFIVSVEKEIILKETQLSKHKKISIYIDWFNSFFNQLMIKIERQILWSLLVEFNEVFVKWFNILIDDDSLNVRLDEEFSPVLIQNEHETEIENLSGGEKTSLALAYRLALNKTINDFMTTIKTKDIIILDEPTDGFSDTQLDKVKDVLDILGLKQTIIVSHESKIENLVDNVIRLTKSENESYVI